MVPIEARLQFDRDGYALAQGLFNADEVQHYIHYFMAMRDRGGDNWAEGGVDFTSEDSLKQYPRLLQPHRGDKVAFDYMIDARIREWMFALLDEEPLGVQTMVYFKPPLSRGQALHQDQRYLQVEPGTCVAAWLALDDCDLENGCMSVVPGSHRLPLLCPRESDPNKSWTGDEVPVPPGMTEVPMVMRAGDVLFFNGQLIHGSGRNDSPHRFRRIIVGHYIAAAAEKVGEYYFPVYDFDGNEVTGIVTNKEGNGPCGVAREEHGKVVFDMVGQIEAATAAH